MCAAIVALFLGRPAAAEGQASRPKPKRTLIIAIPNVTWQDVRAANAPNLHWLMEHGAVGLMAVAAPSDPDPNRTWVTLGAGRGATADGPAAIVLTLPHGRLQADVDALSGANRSGRTGARVGLLGEGLHKDGLTTAIVGGPALPDGRLGYPGAALLIMDTRGRVDAHVEVFHPVASVGRIGSDLDLRDYREAIPAAVSQHDLVVLDFSDVTELTRRLGPSHDPGSGETWMTPPALMPTGLAVRSVDQVIGFARRALAGADALIVVVCPQGPYSADALEHRALGWVVVFDTAGRTAGLLSSRATRWPGIITAPGLAPTILAWWGVSPGASAELMDGRPISVVAAVDALPRLDALDRMLTDRYRLRVVVVKWYIGYGLVVVLLGLLAGLVRRPSGGSARPGSLRIAAGPGLALALIPAGLAVAALVPPGHDAGYLAVTGLAALAIALIACVFKQAEQGIAISLLLGSGIIVVDVLTGSWLMRRSALEMGVMNGLRFYGISNDFMGCLVGMGVLGIAALMQWRPRWGWVAGANGALLVLAIGAPFWGANWGGSVTAASGLAALVVLGWRRRRWVRGLAGALIVGAGAAAPALLDLIVPEAQRSHIGASAAALLSGRTGELADIAARKLQQNLSILRMAPWSVIAAGLCAALFWFLLRKGGGSRQVLAEKPLLSAGIAAALIAAVVAMVVNDSGVAAGFGPILAALGVTVFLASRAEQEAA